MIYTKGIRVHPPSPITTLFNCSLSSKLYYEKSSHFSMETLLPVDKPEAEVSLVDSDHSNLDDEDEGHSQGAVNRCVCQQSQLNVRQ